MNEVFFPNVVPTTFRAQCHDPVAKNRFFGNLLPGSPGLVKVPKMTGERESLRANLAMFDRIAKTSHMKISTV